MRGGKAAPADYGIDLASIALDGSERTVGNFGKGVSVGGIIGVEWCPNGENILVSTLGTYPVGQSSTPPNLNGRIYVAKSGSATSNSTAGIGGYASWSPDGSRIAVLGGYALATPPRHKVVRLSTVAPDGSGYTCCSKPEPLSIRIESGKVNVQANHPTGIGCSPGTGHLVRPLRLSPDHH